MNTPRPAWQPPTYLIIRLSPLLTVPMVIDLRLFLSEVTVSAVTNLLALLAVFMLWNLTEGVLMLWHRENAAASDKARGYGFVGILFGVITLSVLPLVRTKSSQAEFITLLTTLALRGIARAGWEQQKALVGTLAAFTSHTLMALLSFSTINQQVTWQSFLISVALAAAVTPCEMAWNCGAFSRGAHETPPCWAVPALRVLLFLGPVCIATLALQGDLPRSYFAIWATLVLSQRIAQRASVNNSISAVPFSWTAAAFLLFVGILVGCLLYSTPSAVPSL